MQSQEAAIYRDIQKNADRMMKTLDTLSDKVYDSDLAIQISRQSLKYSQIHNEATQKLVDSKAEHYKSTYLEDFVQKGNLQYNTLLNTSTGHIAELLIENTTKGIVEMEKTLRHHPDVMGEPADLAKKMLTLEEKNVAAWKEFL